MPQPQKPQRQRSGWIGVLDARDRAIAARAERTMMRFGPSYVHRTPPITRDDIAMPEPEQELEGSELSDRERAEAIARERMRREG
jgi:hypothetical protein